jgi:hypothetical protein
VTVFEIPLEIAEGIRRRRGTVCDRPHTCKECSLSATPRWTITACEWELPGRRYPRLARSKGVAKCLSWREIFLARPSLESFSVASTNRARTSLSELRRRLTRWPPPGNATALFRTATRSHHPQDTLRCGQDAPWKTRRVQIRTLHTPHDAWTPSNTGFHISPARISLRDYR